MRPCGPAGGLTLSQLRALDCAELEGAADGWGRASNRADAARDRIDKQVLVGLASTQEGEAADAAVSRLRVLSRDFQYIYTECGLVRTTLNSFANELRLPQRELRRALDDAESLRFTVHDDGSVSYPAAGEPTLTAPQPPGGTSAGRLLRPPDLLAPPALPSLNPNEAKAQEIADRISRALFDARDIDNRYTGTLRKLTAPEGLGVTSATWTDAYGDATAVRGLADEYLSAFVPTDKSPAERKVWWAGLTQEAREEYLAVFPDLIGNLDGIPSDVRDAANRDNLQLLIGKLEGRAGDDAESQTRLEGLREIDRQLRVVDPRVPPMYLLGIGDEGNGRAIVSYGNPDTARNVSAYVPGLGTALDKGFAVNDLKRARDTAIGAQKYDRSSAAITWLGYDAPQMSKFDVAGTGRAEEGAPAYNSFMSGLVATNHHEDPHLTAIGHSYGSRTVGAAAQQVGGIPGTDDIVFVGSPGVGVDRAEDLGVGKNHVFVGAAENDLVTKLPSKQQVAAGAAGYAVGGPVGAALAADLSDRGDDDLWFGRDPASRAFGARRFEVSDGPLPMSGGVPMPAHSNYFDPHKDLASADNISKIVAGRSRSIKGEEWR